MPLPVVLAALAPYLAAAATGAATVGGGLALNRAVNGPANKRNQNKGISATPSGPVTFPGSQNSPAITAQNLGQEGNALFFNKYNPQQQQLMSALSQLGLQGLQGNDFSFGPIEQQARQGFAQQTIPSIAERFSGLGAQKSSAFGQQLGAAGAGLESDLAGQKQLYNLQQMGLFQNLAGLGLNPQYESIFSPKQPSFGQSLGSSIAGPASSAAIQVLGQLLMNKLNQPKA